MWVFKLHTLVIIWQSSCDIRSLKSFLKYDSANFCKRFSSFFFFSLLFCTLCKNHYNLCMRTQMWLKFGTHIRHLKTNNRINFGVNLINIQTVISNFTHEAKFNFCHTYRVNRFEEQAENWYVVNLLQFQPTPKHNYTEGISTNSCGMMGVPG